MERHFSIRPDAALAACRLDFCPVAAYPFGVGKTVIMGDRKVRLDVLLVDRGLAESREKARALVLAGEVSVDGTRVARPAIGVLPSAHIAVARPAQYVSRGGYKLAHALDRFALDVTGLTM